MGAYEETFHPFPYEKNGKMLLCDDKTTFGSETGQTFKGLYRDIEI
jgi:hypothetical protein